MKKKNNQLLNQQNKGITLIVLIITIIVLLIISGVTINMALGQNGLLNNSKEAAQKYKESQEKEELSLILSDYYMAKIQDDNINLETYLKEKNVTIMDENSDNYVIRYKEYEFTVNKDSMELIDGQKIGSSENNIDYILNKIKEDIINKVVEEKQSEINGNEMDQISEYIIQAQMELILEKYGIIKYDEGNNILGIKLNNTDSYI